MAQIIFGDLQSKLYRPKIDEEARYPYLHDEKKYQKASEHQKKGPSSINKLNGGYRIFIERADLL